jgi:hypothetical protein
VAGQGLLDGVGLLLRLAGTAAVDHWTPSSAITGMAMGAWVHP